MTFEGEIKRSDRSNSFLLIEFPSILTNLILMFNTNSPDKISELCYKALLFVQLRRRHLSVGIFYKASLVCPVGVFVAIREVRIFDIFVLFFVLS